MFSTRRLIHSVFVLSLPLVVAGFGLSIWSALLLVLAALLWRWALSIGDLVLPEKQPAIVLETISTSHFVEKIRWCMDRLGIDYVEKHSGGVIGVVLTGRTVPRLKIRTGRATSSIGNSPEILRFLWGQYGASHGAAASFLKPDNERLAIEKAIDRYGVDLQVWVYYHLLMRKDLTLHIWGVNHPQVPWWQRLLLKLMFPINAAFIRKTFAITDAHYAKAVEHIDERLGDIETRVADGRKSILGGEETDYIDIAFAAISGLWLQPPNYGGGRADASRVPVNKLPGPMQADIERWSEDYPRATAFIMRMYAEERLT